MASGKVRYAFDAWIVLGDEDGEFPKRSSPKRFLKATTGGDVRADAGSNCQIPRAKSWTALAIAVTLNPRAAAQQEPPRLASTMLVSVAICNEGLNPTRQTRLPSDASD